MQPLAYVKMVRRPRQQSGPFLFGLFCKLKDVAWNTEPWNSQNPSKTPRFRKEKADLTDEEKITAVEKSNRFRDEEKKHGWQKGLVGCWWSSGIGCCIWEKNIGGPPLRDLRIRTSYFVATFKEAWHRNLECWRVGCDPLPPQKKTNHVFSTKTLSNSPENMQILSGQCCLQSNSQMSTRTEPCNHDWKMSYDFKMICVVVFLVITTPLFSNRCETDLEGSKLIYKKTPFYWNDWFLSLWWCWNRTSKYLWHLNAIHLWGLFWRTKKAVRLLQRPSSLSTEAGFWEMCFLEVKILQGFLGKKHNTMISRNSIFWIASFECFKQKFIQFGGMKRRNTGVNIWNLLTLNIEMHPRGKNKTWAPLEWISLTSPSSLESTEMT